MAGGLEGVLGFGVVVELVFVGVAVEEGFETLGVPVGMPGPAFAEVDIAIGAGLQTLLVVLVIELPL